MTLTVHSGMGPGPVLQGCKICPLLTRGKTKLKFQLVAGFDLRTQELKSLRYLSRQKDKPAFYLFLKNAGLHLLYPDHGQDGVGQVPLLSMLHINFACHITNHFKVQSLWHSIHSKCCATITSI